MGKYHAYQVYEDTHNEFVSELPQGWVLSKFKYEVDYVEGPGILANDFHEAGVPLLRIQNVKDRFTSGDIKTYLDPQKVKDKWEHFKTKTGDLLISGSASTDLVTEVTEQYEGSVPYTGLIRLRAKQDRTDKNYVRYFVQSELFKKQIDNLKTGSTIQHFGPIHLQQIVYPSALVSEQTQIANFLDHETAKIDTLIEKQQQLIKLLKEKRQAVISHAVTKGLPSVNGEAQAPMKDTGVEWLGEVPEHWEVKRVRHAFDIDNNLRTPIDRQSRMDMIGEYRYYGPTGVLNHINRFNVEGKYFLLGEDGDHFLKFKDKSMTILVDGQFNVNNHAHLLKGKGTCSTEWGCLLFEHKDIFPWLIKQGVGRYKLQKTVLLDIPVVVPPEKEQLYILGEINKRKRTFDEIEDKANQSINMLKERRTALISAAVTGKIDVRNWQAPTHQDQALEQTA